MEYWSNGVMEEWSNGFLEPDQFISFLALSVHSSTTPSLQYSIIPYCE